MKRVDDDGLGYANVEGRSVSFTADSIQGYLGQPLAELGIVEGATIGFVRDNEGRIVEVHPSPKDEEFTTNGNGSITSRGFFESPQAADPPQQFTALPSNDNQGELHPEAPCGGRIRPGRALPPKTRDFGRLIDTSKLQAGDLLLTRDMSGESWISNTIADVQKRIGYGDPDARWVHAAMYLGDGANVVEATVDPHLVGSDVRITHLDDYCDGSNILRFRRSTFITQERDGFLVCLRALSKLRKPYSVIGAFKAWWDVRIGGAVAWESDGRNILSKCVVCSTLYADSFNQALRLSLGEINGVCAPAWFSATNDFVDVQTQWLEIAN